MDGGFFHLGIPCLGSLDETFLPIVLKYLLNSDADISCTLLFDDFFSLTRSLIFLHKILGSWYVQITGYSMA